MSIFSFSAVILYTLIFRGAHLRVPLPVDYDFMVFLLIIDRNVHSVVFGDANSNGGVRLRRR